VETRKVSFFTPFDSFLPPSSASPVSPHSHTVAAVAGPAVLVQL